MTNYRINIIYEVYKVYRIRCDGVNDEKKYEIYDKYAQKLGIYIETVSVCYHKY